MKRLCTDLLGIDAGPGADGRGEPGRGDGTADVPLEFRAAHRSKEPPVERFHLNEPLRASGAVAQDRFGSRFRGNRLEPRADVGERLVPGDTNEIPLTLPAFALQRVQHAIGVVHALEVVIHLRAERAAGERVRPIARQLYGRPIPHFDNPRAGVRTVVPARAAHRPQRRGGGEHRFLGHRSQDFRRRQGPSPDWHSRRRSGRPTCTAANRTRAIAVHAPCFARAPEPWRRRAERIRSPRWVWMLQVVLPQQVLAVVVAVRRSDDGVDVLDVRHGRIHQVAQADRALVIELDQDDRDCGCGSRRRCRARSSPIHANHVRSRCARTSSIFTRACPSSMLLT